MRKTRAKRISTATLRQWLRGLLPIINEAQFDVVVADLGRHAGFCRSWCAIGRAPDRSLILLDEKILRRGGWRTTVDVAVHEFAHVVRAEWLPALDFYAADEYASDAEEALRSLRANDVHVGDEFGEDSGNAIAFGAWANGEHCGSGHDAFFFFINYMLSRRAVDRGWLDEDRVVVRSRTPCAIATVDEIAEAAATARGE